LRCFHGCYQHGLCWRSRRSIKTVRDLLASKETEIIKTFSYDSSLNQSFRALPPEALRVVSRLLEEDAFGRTEERLAALNLTSALLIRYARTSLDAGRALNAVRKILDVHSDDVQLLLITSGILSAYGTEEQDLPRFEALMPSVGVNTRDMLILAGRNMIRNKRGEAAAAQWARKWDSTSSAPRVAPVSNSCSIERSRHVDRIQAVDVGPLDRWYFAQRNSGGEWRCSRAQSKGPVDDFRTRCVWDCRHWLSDLEKKAIAAYPWLSLVCARDA
jgi:hypothetical protein